MSDFAILATIRRTAEEIPDFRTAREAEHYGLVLRGHIQFLLPEVRSRHGVPAVPDPSEASAHVISWTEALLDRDYGDTLDTAAWHVENLAVGCRLLLNRLQFNATVQEKPDGHGLPIGDVVPPSGAMRAGGCQRPVVPQRPSEFS